EDGIRDRNVTGVQTCALPISLTGEVLIEAGEKITRAKAEQADAAGVSLVTLTIEGKPVKVITNGCVDAQPFFSFDVKECGINERSEERRVGNECRSGGARGSR